MFSRLVYFFKKHSLPDRLETDRRLLLIVGLLVVFGIVMLASASSVVAYNTYGDAYYFFKHQLIGILIGAAAFWILSRLDYRHLKKFALPFLIISVLLLCLVFIPGLGRVVNGSRSWVNILGFSLQPAEFVKLSLLIYLAALFEKRDQTPLKFRSFLLIYGGIALLMLLQPDIGTLFVLTITCFAVYYLGGGKLKHILISGLIGVIALTALSLVPQGQYRLNRYRCLVDSNFDPQGACYQINQSLIAIGSGGIFGRGLGESRQKFLYLPEVQNDFIFAVIAEETGLVFAGLLILLFALLFHRGYRISQGAPDGFGRNLSAGIIIWLVIQASLNIGGIMRILPMTGVPLPLVSYGGSAVMAALAALGIVASISKQSRIS